MFAPQLPDIHDPAGEAADDPYAALAAGPAWADAACRALGAGALALFFSDAIPDINRAKELCLSCPHMAACLDGALARREPAGVWGGQLFKDGAVLAFKRPRGRPRKHPLPAGAVRSA